MSRWRWGGWYSALVRAGRQHIRPLALEIANLVQLSVDHHVASLLRSAPHGADWRSLLYDEKPARDRPIQ